jgi:hypothetical protein
MGAFIANFHVRHEDSQAVRRAALASGAAKARVAGPSNGWVSLYDERASTQDEEWIARLAGELSSRLQTASVAFMVHDSDIARYWLSDQGQLRDEYSSVPDYFEDVSAAEKRRLRGRADVFLRYCRPGATAQQIEAVLRDEVVFAEDTVRKLAEFLGIDPDRAIEDFNHPEGGGGGVKLRPFPGDDDDPEDCGVAPSSASGAAGMMQKMQEQLASMFAAPRDQGSSPASNALVEAAAAGNMAEIDRLASAGTDVNAPGLLALDAPSTSGLLAKIGRAPKMSLPPLMAAASKGQTAAVQRLLELGAVTEAHPLYGSALHVAAQAGAPETVRVLLASGIPANVKNQQGLTPRALIEALRRQIAMAKELAEAMPALKKVYNQVGAKLASLPEQGWTACEELLRQAGG